MKVVSLRVLRAAAASRAVSLAGELAGYLVLDLLDAPGQAVYERKGESEPALLEAARQDLLSLQGRIA